MEKYANDIDKLRNEFYDKLVEMYGDHYKYISVEIKMLEEIPRGLTITTSNGWKEYDTVREFEKRKDMEGPKIENSGAMWDKSNSEKVNS
jgi:hypothetical protein